MTVRTELLEAALESYPEGIALFDVDEHVVFWNRSAEILTGYSVGEVMGRVIPAALEPLTECRNYEVDVTPSNGPRLGRGSLVQRSISGDMIFRLLPAKWCCAVD